MAPRPIFLLAALCLAAPVHADRRERPEAFESSMTDLRDSLGSSARGVGARFQNRPPMAMPQAHGRRYSGPLCKLHPQLDSAKFKWVFDQESAQFYIKHPRLEIEFGAARCDDYESPPEAHHGDLRQAIRTYPGAKDYDLKVVVDDGSDKAAVLLVTKAGAMAVYYGEFPIEDILKGLELPKRSVARSLTESVSGKAALRAVLPSK